MKLEPVNLSTPPVPLVVAGKVLGVIKSMSATYDEVPGYTGRQMTKLEIELLDTTTESL